MRLPIAIARELTMHLFRGVLSAQHVNTITKLIDLHSRVFQSAGAAEMGSLMAQVNSFQLIELPKAEGDGDTGAADAKASDPQTNPLPPAGRKAKDNGKATEAT